MANTELFRNEDEKDIVGSVEPEVNDVGLRKADLWPIAQENYMPQQASRTQAIPVTMFLQVCGAVSAHMTLVDDQHILQQIYTRALQQRVIRIFCCGYH